MAVGNQIAICTTIGVLILVGIILYIIWDSKVSARRRLQRLY